MDYNLPHTMPGIWEAINNSRQMLQDVNTGLNQEEYGVGVKALGSGASLPGLESWQCDSLVG